MILIWIANHALMDGVSAISITAAGSMEYSKDYFFPTKDIGFVQQLILKSMAPFYFLQLVFE